MNRIPSLMCFCFMLSSVGVQAQMLPKHIYSTYVSGNSASTDFHSQGAPKDQWIYRPSELPGLPVGPIHSVYFRVGRTYGISTPNPTVYDSMRLKMGYTPDTSFKDTLMPGGTRYQYKTGLTQVFFQPQFTVYGADSVGTWVRFPIDGFSYNTTANLVVELSRGHQGITANGFDWMTNRGCNMCFMAGYYEDVYFYSKPVGYQADIGFNDATGAVGGLVNLKGYYSYPNPSEGLFTVGFEPWSGFASTVQITVSDMAGRQVWQRSYQGVQASLFTANVDLRGRPKGIYILRVQADAAQALKRVVLE